MLTTVRLDGVPGKLFGSEWKLAISSPSEALRLIEANKPGLKKWIIQNRDGLDGFRVTCVYDTGVEEDLDNQTFPMLRKNLVSVRFTPILRGASSTVKIIVGVVLVVAGIITENPYLIKIGAVLILGGIVEALSPRPKTGGGGGVDNINSYYFDGPANTEQQGSPVPLIYGQVMVGSHAISASIAIDEDYTVDNNDNH